jgi:hypothetical protein
MAFQKMRADVCGGAACPQDVGWKNALGATRSTGNGLRHEVERLVPKTLDWDATL